MEFLFPYHKAATETSDIIQKSIVKDLGQLVSNGRNIAYFSPPKTGKQSIINCVSENLKRKGNYHFISFNLLKFFTKAAFLQCYRETFMKIYDELSSQSILSFNIDFKHLTVEETLNLPELISRSYDIKIVVVFIEFHNILTFDNCPDFLDEFEKIVKKHKKAGYIFTGSMVNRMKFIFSEQKYFFNFVDVVEAVSPTRDECYKYLEDRFAIVGKVVYRNVADMMYDMCGGHLWYIMQLASICHSLTPGYITYQVARDAMERLVKIHDIRFKDTINDLTDNQFNLILAVLDHVSQFSSAKSMEKYRLNSSAQIVRSREALLKKEVISFDGNGEAYIIDPIFEYWLRNYYLSGR